MTKQALVQTLTVGLMALFAGLGAAHGQDLRLQRGGTGTVQYITGGVGAEERAALRAMVGDYNLKLVMAVASGEYLSDLTVMIEDSVGKTLLKEEANGPWFLAKLPPGDYKVTVALEDRRRVQQVSVDGGLRTLHFRWGP